MHYIFARALTCFAASVVAFGLCTGSARAQKPVAANAGVIDLVKEFIRECERLYHFQQMAKDDFVEDTSSTGKIMTSIRVGAEAVTEMSVSVRTLNRMQLSGQANDLRTLLVQMDSDRIATLQDSVAISKKLFSAPEPGVNYGALMALMPKVTAEIDKIDQLMFKMSQALALSLLDPKRIDPDGEMRHLIVTRQERASLIKEIDLSFGKDLDDEHPSYIVASGWAIKLILTKPGNKSADED